MNPLSFFVLAASAIVQASGSALMKYASAFNAGPNPDRARFFAFMGLAMVLFCCGFPLYVAGLSRLKLSVAQPIFSASMFVATTAIALLFFKEAMGPLQFLGIALILSGIALVALR
jgi:multidrug transporter EmrE-like cation transporter